jgi:hypothetical protein
MGEGTIDEDVVEPTRMGKRQDEACEGVALKDSCKKTSDRECE